MSFALPIPILPLHFCVYYVPTFLDIYIYFYFIFFFIIWYKRTTPTQTSIYNRYPLEKKKQTVLLVGGHSSATATSSLSGCILVMILCEQKNER